MHRLAPPVLFTFLFLAGLAGSRAQLPAEFEGVHRAVFLGDSITYAGGFAELVETGLIVRAPDKRIEFLDIGLSSETVSGLSEEGHANGKYPRPDLHERLERALEKTKPDLVIACYGMNDGIYYPPSEDRFSNFRYGIVKLKARVVSANARLILLTPPVFDPVPIAKQTQPANADRFSFSRPYAAYDDVLTQYSTWIVSQRAPDFAVIDVHAATVEFLADQRRKNAAFQFSKDGVHPNATGHAVIARTILEAWQLLRRADQVLFDESTAGQTEMEIALPNWLPMPLTEATTETAGEPALPRDAMWLTIRNLTAPHYGIFEGNKRLGSFTRAELRWGVNLLTLTDLPPNRRTAEILSLVRARSKLLKDTWLTAIGNKRPGGAPGLPLATAEAQAAEIEGKIAAIVTLPQAKITLRAE
jgi:lysophospholipase L1-like esterase